MFKVIWDAENNGVRFSMKDYIEQNWLINIPLYAVCSME